MTAAHLGRVIASRSLAALALLAAGCGQADPGNTESTGSTGDAAGTAAEQGTAASVTATTFGARALELRETGRGDLDLESAPDRWPEALEAGNPLGALRLGLESRWGQCLVRGSKLKGRIDSPTPGLQLVFGFGAREPRGQPQAVRLSVSHRWGQGEWSATEFPIDTADVWHEARLEVPAVGLPGDELSYKFELLFDAATSGPGAAVWGALEQPRLYTPDSAAPVVLLITSDTHRGDHLGSAGRGVDIQTPVIDALAERSLQFTDCFATAHITLPSHAAIFTGIHPRDSGVRDNKTRLSTDARTLSEAFSEAGYRTFAVTSLSLLTNSNSGLGQGFERMSAPVHRRDSADTIELAMDWIREAEGSPLFLWLHVFDAHSPYKPPAPYDRLYYPAERDPFDEALPQLSESQQASWLEGLRDVEYVRGLYRGEISYLDSQLERLFAMPQLERALTVFTADHGESLGERDIWWGHRSPFPEGIHVPLILSGPAVPRGLRVDRPVTHLDLGRTVLDLAGLERTPFPGENLLDLLEAEAPIGPRFSLGASARYASITAAGWHLVLALRNEHTVELFELETDPRCERDLAGTEPARAAELRSALITWLRATQGGLTGLASEDEAALAQLVELGYAGQLGETGESDELFPDDCACASCRSFD